jgi:hypothetical protein
VGGAPKSVSGREPTVHLLPIYDEYLVAYRDRDAVPHTIYSAWTRNIRHALVIGGQLAGTWSTIPAAKGVMLEVETSRRLTAGERRALARVAARYGRFLGVPVSLSLT